MQRIETLEGKWDSPRMAYTRLLALALHLKHGQPDMACYLKAMPILDFFADLHNLQIQAYVSVRAAVKAGLDVLRALSSVESAKNEAADNGG